MWVSPKRRERGKGVWGVRPFLQEDRGSFAKRSHDDTYYIFDKSVISNNYYLCSARVSFNSPLVVEERPLLQAQVNYLGFFVPWQVTLRLALLVSEALQIQLLSLWHKRGSYFRRCARVMSSCHFPDCLEAGLSSASSMLLVCDPYCSAGRLVVWIINSTFADREQLVGSLPYVIERYKGKH